MANVVSWNKPGSLAVLLGILKRTGWDFSHCTYNHPFNIFSHCCCFLIFVSDFILLELLCIWRLYRLNLPLYMYCIQIPYEAKYRHKYVIKLRFLNLLSVCSSGNHKRGGWFMARKYYENGTHACVIKIFK